jgi:hypothetical protein
MIEAHNESAIRTLAKQIVRIRTQKESMMKSKATLTSVGLQTTVCSNLYLIARF